MFSINKSFRVFVIFFGTFFLAGQLKAQQLSDQKIKTNIAPIENPLQLIKSLQPLRYEYNTTEYRHLKLPGGVRYGFIAEDVQKVLPGVVYNKPYSYISGKNATRQATVKNVDMESLVPVLIASLKEQQQQIEQLRAEIESLKNRN